MNGVESHVPSFDERREIKGEPKEKIFLLEDGYARNCHVPRVRINLRSRWPSSINLFSIRKSTEIRLLRILDRR